MNSFLRKYGTPSGIGNYFFPVLLLAVLIVACSATGEERSKISNEASSGQTQVAAPAHILTGADQTDVFLPAISGKRIAIVANQTSQIGKTHLVDSLVKLKINITKVFALEHGFRGDVQAGESIKNGKDAKTGIPIVSLYGNNKKPKAEQLKDVDIIIFDIQDVGARFYTYISSLHYIMEAAAEHKKKVLILDRPNPNGFYVDGPVLDMKHKSFVGMHPVPVVHGMTVGEYAQMINGEGWLLNKVKCELKIIPCKNYTHDSLYVLPVKPSPNLSTQKAIYLYPSLCLFEGTIVSVGRGTDIPFQCIGMPVFKRGTYKFTPKSVQAAKNPPHKDVECNGYDLRDSAESVLKTKKLNLSWLIDLYGDYADKAHFFESDGMFVLLSGGVLLKQQIEKGFSEEMIRESWEPQLSAFKTMRKKYLLYPDFTE